MGYWHNSAQRRKNNKEYRFPMLAATYQVAAAAPAAIAVKELKKK
jgi:hypothetical protein